MHDDVDSELERQLKVRRHEGVVANHASAGSMRDFANLAQVGDDHYRIRWCFQKHHLGVRLDGSFNVEHVRRIDKIKLDVVVREYAGEETRGAAVSVVGNDDVFTGLHQ